MHHHRRLMLLGLILCTHLLSSCAREAENSDLQSKVLLKRSASADPFDPLGPAPTVAALFAPDQLSSSIEDRDVALSPDGSLFLFSRMGPRSAILVLRRGPSPVSVSSRLSESWSEASIAPFSGLYGDLEPAFSPDGSQLWFASDRPAPDGESYGHDLWWVTVEQGQFGALHRPGAPVNTEGNEFYPSLTQDGALYFTTTREGGIGQEDIWVSRPEGESWSNPECLSEGVNTASYEFNAFIAPDESYLLFTRWMREGDFGGGDLYVSYRREDGSWTDARNLGASVNTAGLDYCPFVSPDGKTLFFSRKRGREPAEHPTGEPLDYAAYMAWALGPGNGAGDVYWVSAAVLDPLRETALGD